MGLAVAADAEPRYKMIDFGPGTEPHLVNQAGEVAGTIKSLGPKRQTAAFFFSGGTVRIIADPSAELNYPEVLSEDGALFIESRYPMAPRETGPAKTRQFRYANGQLTEWAFPGLPPGVGVRHVRGLNREGTFLIETDERPARTGLLTRGTFVPLTYPTAHIPPDMRAVLVVTSLADGDCVIGHVYGFRFRKTGANVSSEESGFSHGMLFENGVATDLGRFIPSAINQTGVMVGTMAGEGLDRPAVSVTCLRDNAGIHELEVPSGFRNGGARFLNSSGQIVGAGITKSTIGGRIYMDRRAFILEQGRWVDLSTLVSFEGMPFSYLDDVAGINDAGQILCRALAKDGPHAVLLTPTAR